MLQTLSAAVISFAQAIPGSIRKNDPIPMEEPLSGPESASASASTTPVSDTTATDTDPSDAVTGPQHELNHESDIIHSTAKIDL